VSELIKAVDGVVVFKPVNLEPLKRCGASPTWCRRKTGGTTTGCEAAVVDPVILVGLIFNFTKPKWQTLGDSLLFNLAYILASCQITRFAKLILANFWRCSTPTHIKNIKKNKSRKEGSNSDLISRIKLAGLTITT